LGFTQVALGFRMGFDSIAFGTIISLSRLRISPEVAGPYLADVGNFLALFLAEIERGNPGGLRHKADDGKRNLARAYPLDATHWPDSSFCKMIRSCGNGRAQPAFASVGCEAL
jgi:hypothetical protein